MNSFSPAKAASPASLPWPVLVVDDEHDVLLSTRLALRELKPEGRPIELTYAPSAADAFEKLREREYALVLLDVVMESDSAGLDLVPRIRDELGLTKMQIVLRTGQAGKAPEESVVNGYEINSYLEKARGDVTRVRTTVSTALRAWRTLDKLERALASVGALARATRALIGEMPMGQIAEAGIRVMIEIVDPDGRHGRSGFAFVAGRFGESILSGCGRHEGAPRDGFEATRRKLAPNDLARCDDVLREPGIFLGDGGIWMSVHRDDGTVLGFHASGQASEPSCEREVLETIAGHLKRAAEQAAPAG